MALPEGHVARRLRIEGRVKGVGYRAWTVKAARRLGLDGWVRNRIDGTVEVLAVGEGEAVAALLSACWHGPPLARVTHIEDGPAQGIVAAGFEAKPTV